MTEIKEYLERKGKNYETLSSYIMSEDKDDETFQSLLDIFEHQNDKDEFEEYLTTLSYISRNYYRYPVFLSKIKQFFSTPEIYDIFKKNKTILLSLIDNSIISPDKYFKDYLHLHFSKYHDIFFFPEIKNFLSEEERNSFEQIIIKQFGENYTDIFDEKRNRGENDSYICDLIRNDSIDSFVAYVTQSNYPLSGQIQTSLFETNDFLLKQKNATLIEYAAFFGSIHIFNFLRMNYVELKPSLWYYAIHSNSAEMIHLLEDCKVETPDPTYQSLLKEAVKCHHNDITNYLNDNKIKRNDDFSENIYLYGIKYHNYCFFPDDINYNYIFLYICKYNY
ncbi:hypothetical protein M9Y10_015813 [Tritrichomonas musculus]|uniref:DUF3447 domain-containing protein n=1 Tax=Tritrichomonas musculus TaxID=1915356 RepID=A0ABR2I4P2_9EUKA